MQKSRLQVKNQNLPKGWRKVKLGEVGKIITGKTPSTSDPQNFGGPYPFITIPDLKAQRYVEKTERTISKKGAKLMRSLKLPPKTVVVSCLATVGEVGITVKEGFTNQQINAVICDETKVVPEFLYYSLKYSKPRLLTYSGSVYTNISKSKFADFEILILEDINEQKRIASILSAFDEKIELNNRINQTLEQMAQEIFKEWFVKFRFPGYEKVKFVDSELGKIPEGWKIVDLFNYIKFEGGSQPPKEEHIYEYRPGYIRFIQNRDYTSDAHITYIKENKRNKLCNEFDIMMDKYGEAGKVRFGLAGAYNVALAKITPKPPLMREYLRWFLMQPHIQKLIESSATASTRASVNKIVFKNLKILIPPKPLMEQLESIGKQYIIFYLQLKKEGQKLAALRDLLLPKLISGEIRL